MSDQQKLVIDREQAKAWRSISTFASLASVSKLMEVQILLDKINSEKRRIDKLIDNMED